MNIPKKKILGDWVTVGENKFKIDYPTRDQKKKLSFILLSLGLTEDENKSIQDNDIDSLSPSTQANVVLANKDYQETYLRFTIKDWDLKYEDGEEFKCVLKNNELKKRSGLNSAMQ
ncbi:MAG: hypothetical protein IPH11_12805 [Ignavibacteriales bacterium]|nr:hypothetical protein [Ignavibacteriales bacterium]